MRYYFNLDEDGHILTDTDGEECANFGDMRKKAMSILAEITSHMAHDADRHRLSVDVLNSSHSRVYRATLTIDGEHIR